MMFSLFFLSLRPKYWDIPEHFIVHMLYRKNEILTLQNIQQHLGVSDFRNQNIKSGWTLDDSDMSAYIVISKMQTRKKIKFLMARTPKCLATSDKPVSNNHR